MHYTQDSLHEFLVLQEEHFFEIVLPLGYHPTPDDPFCIRCQYMVAGYMGELLSAISKRFSYHVPCVHSFPSFRFRVKVLDMELLAEVLFMTINGCYLRNEVNEKFHENMDVYWQRVAQNKFDPAAWGLLYICNKYLRAELGG